MRPAAEVLITAAVALVAAILVYVLVIMPQSGWPEDEPFPEPAYVHPAEVTP